MKVKDYKQENQTDFQNEIRRSCRLAVDRFGGLRHFARAIGEDEATWFNRLTPGRTVGFDVEWLKKVFITTGDYELLMPFFKRGKIDRHGIITKIAQKLNFYAFLFPRLRIPKKNNHDDTRYEIVEYLFRAGERILRGE